VEVAVVVEQPDGDERQAEVARRLEVVAGEYAEATRVERERVVYAELGAEVGHGALARYLRGVARGPGVGRRVGVTVEALGQAGDALDVARLGRHLPQVELGCFDEQAARVVPALLPDLRVEVAHHGLAVRRPAPPEVPRHPPEGRERLGQLALAGLAGRLTLHLFHRMNHLARSQETGVRSQNKTVH
jgi:hypothetical protein